MNIKLGPTGHSSIGHVLDVNKTHLERKLKDYDEYLYLKWNPKKLKGWGTWEIRRRPEKPSVEIHYLDQGSYLLEYKYKELDIVNHVTDVPFLNYSIIEKVKNMDLWKGGRIDETNVNAWQDRIERNGVEWKEREMARTNAAAIYNFKQEKTAIRDLREAILSGTNPNLLGKYWGQKP